MSLTSPWRKLHGDSRGGAVVELAISTLVVIPLVLFGSWFSDVFHWKLKLEEASISTGMDLTAFQVHDFSTNKPDFTALYDRARSKAVNGSGAMKELMASSFDSARTDASPADGSVFTVPGGLSVSCKSYLGGKPSSRARSYTMNESRPGERERDLNTDTWMTCSAQARIRTAGFPGTFREMGSESSLIPNAARFWNFPLCGVGPGVQGCGGNGGFAIMLDDWALSSAAQNEDLDMPLSIVDWPHKNPTKGDVEPSAHDTVHRNYDYARMARRFWRTPEEISGGNVMQNGMAVAGAEEMGFTDRFHVSYRYTGDHSYDAQEQLDGQKGAYGGPDGQQRQDPHTGGPWHERNAVGTNGKATGPSEATFDNRSNGSQEHYMGIPDWPVDD